MIYLLAYLGLVAVSGLLWWVVCECGHVDDDLHIRRDDDGDIS